MNNKKNNNSNWPIWTAIYIYINVVFTTNTQSMRVFKKSRIRGSRQYVIWSKVFRESDILGRWKIVAMRKTSGHQGTLIFFEMVNGHFEGLFWHTFDVTDYPGLPWRHEVLVQQQLQLLEHALLEHSQSM